MDVQTLLFLNFSTLYLKIRMKNIDKDLESLNLNLFLITLKRNVHS